MNSQSENDTENADFGTGVAQSSDDTDQCGNRWCDEPAVARFMWGGTDTPVCDPHSEEFADDYLEPIEGQPVLADGGPYTREVGR